MLQFYSHGFPLSSAKSPGIECTRLLSLHGNVLLAKEVGLRRRGLLNTQHGQLSFLKGIKSLGVGDGKHVSCF